MSTSPVPAPVPEPVTLATEAPAAAGGRGRASWSGLLQLSLVTIPVKAYPASAAAGELPCHRLHAGCGQRIRYHKHCPTHGPVDAGALVSGYEYAPQQYLVLDPAELDHLRPARDRILTLECFLDAHEIDPVLFAGRSLYLLPDGPAAHRAYAVLVQGLDQRHKAGLGRVVLCQRRQLVLVRPASRLLTVHTLHYPARLRSRALLEAELRPTAATAAEGQLAGALIDAGSHPVRWADYRDDSAEHLAALVEARLHDRPPGPAAPAPAPIPSLLEALRQSVAAAQAPRARREAPAAARAGSKYAPRRPA